MCGTQSNISTSESFKRASFLMFIFGGVMSCCGKYIWPVRKVVTSTCNICDTVERHTTSNLRYFCKCCKRELHWSGGMP